jgi:peptidoglycan/LPS O-acetylase OafA/YrhL
VRLASEITPGAAARRSLLVDLIAAVLLAAIGLIVAAGIGIVAVVSLVVLLAIVVWVGVESAVRGILRRRRSRTSGRRRPSASRARS